ncbi:MAG: glucose 1-dehydrogenase [Alphaproteobacteria bacterium]|nr:glucose 1-dehydrogenase [Alphaproteobacteria bacterium]
MAENNQRLKAKVAVVTGGASGLGLAIAAMMARDGARVIITDIQGDQQQAEKIGVEFIRHDVTDERQWITILDRIDKKYGRLDILVNNAGISGGGTGTNPETTTIDQWRKVQATNSDSVFLGCKYAIDYMRRSGGGSIINMSSIAALVATPFITAYGASKAAVRQLTMSVALHCATTGSKIRCNSVHPGQIRTPMLEKLFVEAADQMTVPVAVAEQRFLERIPLGQFGTPDDIASMVVFLASDEAKHITGAQFVVDGGMQLNG